VRLGDFNIDPSSSIRKFFRPDPSWFRALAAARHAELACPELSRNGSPKVRERNTWGRTSSIPCHEVSYCQQLRCAAVAGVL